MSIETLTDAFATVGRQYGYEEIEARFAPLADAKIRWQRWSYRWIDFTVSDYLTDAPYEVFKELAEAIYSRIQGTGGAYPQSLHDYLRAHADDLKQTYIESRLAEYPDHGHYDDLLNGMEDEE